MTKILLDPTSNLNSKEGYTNITSEIEFLKYFDKHTNLLIQGERLCRWAQTFYTGRKQEVSIYTPLCEELSSIVPFLSEHDAKNIEKDIKDRKIDIEYPLTINKVLHSLYPSRIWSSRPSWTHCAEWLTWLITEKPENHYSALITSQVNSWLAIAEDNLKKIYHVTTCQKAIEVLIGWLCIEENEWSALEEKFPISVPEEISPIAREKWIPEIISSEGQFFKKLNVSRVPFSLLRLAAQETFNYLKEHPGKITETHYAQLSEYLDAFDSEWLSRNQKPRIPTVIPKTPEKVIKWFIDEYLPFREWQHITQSEDDKPLVLDYAKEFALWYLYEYPKGLLDGLISEYISFRRVRELTPQNDEIIIVIVMDGLHCIDARTLKQLLLPKIPNCEVVETNYVFAPIPTITEDSKEALLRAVPPENIHQVGFTGEVVSMKSSLADRVRSASPPITLFWRLVEPDSTYHRINKSETLKFDVKGSLSSAADKIHEIIQSIPNNVKFKIIITTDHGRMLGESKYCIPVPDGYDSHGRVAKGESNDVFPASGVIIRDEVAFLYSERFGTKHDLAIPLSENAFQTDNELRKMELYSHGGLFPEEVIIPWYVFMKPEEKPNVKITFTGKGQTRKKAVATFFITNSSDSKIFLEKIIIDHPITGRIEKDYDLEVPSLARCHVNIELLSWPSQSDKKEMVATASMRSSWGQFHEIEIEKSFESEEMYSAPDILEDLL